MAGNARKSGNPGSITITEFARPGAIDWVAIAAILTLYGAGVATPWIVPGSKAWDLLKELFPGGPEQFFWIMRNVVKWLALVHAFEAVLFDQIRMRKHGVPRWSALWWKWEISCFVEGIGAWKRIGKVIAQKQLKRN
jgi:hypothetical protein